MSNNEREFQYADATCQRLTLGLGTEHSSAPFCDLAELRVTICLLTVPTRKPYDTRAPYTKCWGNEHNFVIYITITNY